MDKPLAISVIAVGLIAGLVFNRLSSPGDSCTIFTVQKGEQVYFASNEDWHSGDLYLGFSPGTSGSYGVMKIGYMVDGVLGFQSAINDQGLAWAINSIPATKMTYEQDKQYNIDEDNYFSMLEHEVASVEEAVALAEKFEFWADMKMQIHIADKSGVAVVISPGAQGKLVYSWKPSGDGHLISTNFNLANPTSGYQDGRYETVEEMLEDLDTQDLGHKASDILNKVSLNTLTTYTMISSVTDLSSGDSVFYYMSQFDEAARFNIYEQIKKEERVVSMREMFSDVTVAAGDKAYRSFELRFTLAKAAVIATGICVVVGIIIIARMKTRQRKQRNRP